jgi:hypothetical protein
MRPRTRKLYACCFTPCKKLTGALNEPNATVRWLWGGAAVGAFVALNQAGEPVQACVAAGRRTDDSGGSYSRARYSLRTRFHAPLPPISEEASASTDHIPIAEAVSCEYVQRAVPMNAKSNEGGAAV